MIVGFHVCLCLLLGLGCVLVLRSGFVWVIALRACDFGVCKVWNFWFGFGVRLLAVTMLC